MPPCTQRSFPLQSSLLWLSVLVPLQTCAASSIVCCSATTRIDRHHYSLAEGEFLFSNDYVSRQQFFDTLAGRLRNLPGVKAVALSDTAPPVGFVHTRPARTLQAAGRSVNQSQQAGIVAWRSVSPDYFAALGIPILKGRSFNPQDRIGNQNPILYWSLSGVLLGSLMTALVPPLRTLIFQVPVENPALFALAACLMIVVAFRRSATSIHPGSKNGSRRDAARLPIERCSLET